MGVDNVFSEGSRGFLRLFACGHRGVRRVEIDRRGGGVYVVEERFQNRRGLRPGLVREVSAEGRCVFRYMGECLKHDAVSRVSLVGGNYSNVSCDNVRTELKRDVIDSPKGVIQLFAPFRVVKLDADISADGGHFQPERVYRGLYILSER